MSKVGLFQRAVDYAFRKGGGVYETAKGFKGIADEIGKIGRAAGRTVAGAHRTEAFLGGVGSLYAGMFNLPFEMAMSVGGKMLSGAWSLGKATVKGADQLLLGTAAHGSTAFKMAAGGVKQTDRRLLGLAGWVQKNPRKAIALGAGAAAVYGGVSAVEGFHSDYQRRAEQMELAKGRMQNVNAAMMPASFRFSPRRPLSDMNAGNYTLSAHYGRV